MKRFVYSLLFCGVVYASSLLAEPSDRQRIIETNDEIRRGFVEQNIDHILKFHHPEVVKVFSFTDGQIGHTGMREALTQSFANHRLSFLGNTKEMESLSIHGDSATMIAEFTVLGDPKTDDHEPFTFSGKTMIVYLRDERSPTGWWTYREMIVPKQ